MKLTIVYSDVDGIVSKSCKFRDLIIEQKPEVICLTETKLNSIESNATPYFDDYEVWRKD